jgi:hypothetical protein
LHGTCCRRFRRCRGIPGYRRLATCTAVLASYSVPFRNAADLLYEVVNRRYEQRSILITTNKSFKYWNQVFTNASRIVTRPPDRQ